MNIFFDLETTGLNPHTCEIIEAYFEKENGEALHFYARPAKWSEEAEAIHGFSREETRTFPKLSEGLKKLESWLPREPFNFVCYVNPKSNIVDNGVGGNTHLGYYHYDVACLKQAFFDAGKYFWFMQTFKFTPVSVLELVKRCYALGLIHIHRKNNGRVSFSQENVAASLGISYNSHKADEDVKAMRKIYEYCINSTGTSSSNMDLRESSKGGGLQPGQQQLLLGRL